MFSFLSFSYNGPLHNSTTAVLYVHSIEENKIDLSDDLSNFEFTRGLCPLVCYFCRFHFCLLPY